MSVVVSVRIPKWLKEELEELSVDYASEVRAFLLELVRRRKAERIKQEMDRIRSSLKGIEGNLAAELVREDRDER